MKTIGHRCKMPAFTDFCDAKLRRFFELCNLLHEKNASTRIFIAFYMLTILRAIRNA